VARLAGKQQPGVDVPGQYAYAIGGQAQRYADLQMESDEARGELWHGAAGDTSGHQNSAAQRNQAYAARNSAAPAITSCCSTTPITRAASRSGAATRRAN